MIDDGGMEIEFEMRRKGLQPFRTTRRLANDLSMISSAIMR